MKKKKAAHGSGRRKRRSSGVDAAEDRGNDRVDLVEIALKGSVDDLLEKAQSLRKKAPRKAAAHLQR